MRPKLMRFLWSTLEAGIWNQLYNDTIEYLIHISYEHWTWELMTLSPLLSPGLPEDDHDTIVVERAHDI